MVQGNNVAPYKWGIHQFFIRLVINLAEVDPTRKAFKALRVYEHERAHELAGIHGSQEAAMHIFAQLLHAYLGRRLGAILVVTPRHRLGRDQMRQPGGHGKGGDNGEKTPSAHRYMAGLLDP